MDTSILTPIAEHDGVLIHEDTTGVVYFLDGSGQFHCRNLRLSKRSRLEWIKRDIDAYRSRGWV
ncbi:hypothetical protein UFOVP783_16 [uncultured Caudovirales phage]|uniref:Uncharacterized protein n=1 Tax=uncultured Caudovirales phage TaxID=2100421 RepID=A0A6J5NSZ4_9CAUD|nr:hypothetical protein UFOVP783_16 [uncultured Caudovirales phage]